MEHKLSHMVIWQTIVCAYVHVCVVCVCVCVCVCVTGTNCRL